MEFTRARDLLLKSVPPLPEVATAPADALGLVVTRAVRARMRMPRYDQSAMDGIAVRVVDLVGASARRPVTLRVTGEMPAGTERRLPLRPGCAVRVFTGSPLPRGTEAIVVIEDCEFDDDLVRVARRPRPGEHVRHAGEEIARGDELIAAGMRVTPPVVGLLAEFGVKRVRVRKRPTVGVIVTGDELAAPGEPLGATKIHDAVAPALVAALRWLGITETRTWRVGDDERALRRIMKLAIARCDVLMTVGGASVGAHDHVKAVRGELGVRDLFTRVAMKPGKPNVHGLAPSGVPVLSLPGNPVSALVSFHQLVRPALRVMMGLEPGIDAYVEATLASPVKREPGRLEWLRARLWRRGARWLAEPVRGQGSHMLSGLAAADALIEVPGDVERLRRGDTVRTILVSWDHTEHDNLLSTFTIK